MSAAGIIAAGWGERLGQQMPKALTPVGGRALIDFTLDGFQAAGITQVTCIINEKSTAVRDYVEAQKRPLAMDWIVRTTPSSMHSFLIVLERLSRLGEKNYLMTTVDSICPPSAYANFIADANRFSDADVVLGLTTLIDDEKPLRVAMRGREGTGIMPELVVQDPEAFEIVAMTNNGFQSDYVTAGFYRVSPGILSAKGEALRQNFTALRQYLGYLLKYGFRFYGAPLPPVIDVDRPQDVQAAETLLKR